MPQKPFLQFFMLPEILPLGFILSCLEDILFFKSILLKEMNLCVLTVSCLVGPLFSKNLKNKF